MDAITKFREAGLVPRISVSLKTSADDTVSSIFESVISDAPAFNESGNPDVLPELKEHLRQHITAICHMLAGQPRSDLDFVRDHAKRCAEQKFPLDAVLAAYRCLHRAMVDWIQDSALRSADDSARLQRVISAVNHFCIEYIGAVSTLITSEYVAHTRLVAEAEGDRRTELLNLLLSGYDESDSRAAQVLRRTGYLEQRQSFCIAVARSVNPSEMENAARAERMAAAITQALGNSPVRSLVGIRDNLVTIAMSGPRRLSGWTAPHKSIAERVYPQLRLVGPAALIGMSSDAPSTSHIPAALSEAKLALDFANVADRVMPFSHIPFRSMLVNVAAERMQSALPAWLAGFLEGDRKSRGALSATLRAYAEADMNALKTAKTLSLHPNTIYARMQKINDLTNKDPLSYNALTELLLAIDCATLST